MATTHMRTPKKAQAKPVCPKCGQDLLIIDGSFVRWLTCPHCKYRNLEQKNDQRKPRVTSV